MDFLSDAVPQWHICLVDDEPIMRAALERLFRSVGYDVTCFESADHILSHIEATGLPWDIIVSDVSMPGRSGFVLCQEIRQRLGADYLPIVLVTGNRSREDKLRGLEFGADDLIGKPFEPETLLAKVRSLLKIRSRWQENQKHLQNFSRFISPRLAQIIGSSESNSILTRHRTEVTVMFMDLRNFTSFSESVEPDEVLDVLERYYKLVGETAERYEGTIGHLAGDGIMVFFNDPVPVSQHRRVALEMAREVAFSLDRERENWCQRGYQLHYGMGIADGFATIGGIGYQNYWQYTVIGTVANLAARLCSAASGGQILVSNRFYARSGIEWPIEPLGSMQFKGLREKVQVLNCHTVEMSS